MRALWLADVLKGAGLKVLEEPGWKARGKEMGEVQGVLCHHTAGPLHGNMPSLKTVKDGRPGLRGPLSHLVLARDGTYIIVAAGRCNHAGKGKWPGITNGNSNLIGIEAENTGYTVGKMADPWPEVQIDAYARGIAAILEHLKLPANRAIGHKEWAPTRKIDPTFDMGKFRERIKEIMTSRRKRSFFFPDKEEVVEPKVEEVILPAPGTPDDKVVTPPEDKPRPGLLPHEVAPSATRKVVPTSKSKQKADVEPDPNTLTGKERGVWVKELLRTLGWTEDQAAALTGNAMTESNLDPNATGDYLINKKVVTKETPGAVLSAYGLMKWRQTSIDHLDAFAKENKKTKEDFETQVKFIDWELRNTERRSYDELKKSTDIMEALRAAIGYVKPQGWTEEDPERGAKWQERLVNAFLVKE